MSKAVSFLSTLHILFYVIFHARNVSHVYGFDYIILVSGFRPFPIFPRFLSSAIFCIIYPVAGRGGQCLPARFPFPQTRDTGVHACVCVCVCARADRLRGYTGCPISCNSFAPDNRIRLRGCSFAKIKRNDR